MRATWGREYVRQFAASEKIRRNVLNFRCLPPQQESLNAVRPVPMACVDDKVSTNGIRDRRHVCRFPMLEQSTNNMVSKFLTDETADALACLFGKHGCRTARVSRVELDDAACDAASILMPCHLDGVAAKLCKQALEMAGRQRLNQLLQEVVGVRAFCGTECTTFQFRR